MAVNLEYYKIDEASNSKIKINNALEFGAIFKGTQKKIPITIFNSGDSPAISPEVTLTKHPDGKYEDAFKWKKISFDKDKDYGISLKLPDIEPGTWLKGKTVQFENFNDYPSVAGTKPDQSWLLWEGSAFGWEVYNGWLQHNVDTIDGRALWTQLSSAKDFEFSMRVTIRDGVYGGVILRDEGDSNTGYIVLVQAMRGYLGNVQPNEGVIQIFSGKFTEGISSWKELYKSPSIGVRGTHDFFKIKMKGNRFDFWYNNEQSQNPLYSFVDSENTHTKASKPIICVHAGYGSVLTYFDDIKMEVENDNGIIWIQNQVDNKTPAFGTQLSIFNISYGGVN